MMRALLALALLAIVLPAQAGMNWSGLWRNPDQQGEVLLQHGDAAAAARVYKDERRKAYAELKAGDYAAAARDLAAFDDSDANYNRGNALAYAGDLQGAISAYDAALKRDPHNQDASHNRELVENALKQQPPQQNSNSGQSKDGKPDGNGNSRNSSPQDQDKNQQGGNGQDKQGNQSGNGSNSAQQGKSSANNQAQSGSSGDKSGNEVNSSKPNPSAQGTPQQQGSAADKSKEGKQAGQQGQQSGQDASAKNGQGQSGQAGDRAGEGQSPAAQGESGNQPLQQSRQNGRGNAGPGKQAAQTAQGQGTDDAEQARRDAAASLGYAASDKQDGKEGGSETGVQQSTAPISEQQLAQEQWLRSIPDDPGGLLRRKFMIEYMMRQQKGQQ